MTPKTATSAGLPPATQAAELAELVEAEARWENLRAAPSRTAAVRSTMPDLRRMQAAYETFRARLAAFNQRHPPGHIPELLLNTPARLGLWLQRMSDLYRQVGPATPAAYPAQLLEKAYRCADRIAARLGKDAAPRPAAPGGVLAAVEELEALGRWCNGLTGYEVGAGLPVGG